MSTSVNNSYGGGKGTKKDDKKGDRNIRNEKGTTRKIKQHIQHTTKRIQKLLSHNFTRSKNPNRNPRKQMTVKNSYLRFARR